MFHVTKLHETMYFSFNAHFFTCNGIKHTHNRLLIQQYIQASTVIFLHTERACASASAIASLEASLCITHLKLLHEQTALRCSPGIQ